MDLNDTAATIWIGIDVSKDTLDVCLLRAGGKEKYKQFGNETAGHAKLLRWVHHLAGEEVCHYCLESTGSYSMAIAHFLAEAEQPVSIVNPARIKYAGLAQGVGNKTDKADARLIADYCRKEQPTLWRAAAPEVRELVALVRRLHSVQELVVQEQNRLSSPGLPVTVRKSLQKSIRFLEAEVKRLQKHIKDHIDQHPGLKADKELLLSIPGIGETTAHELLGEMPDVTQFSCAQSVAAYAGLCPREHSSGSSVRKRTRLSKTGNSHLRKALYFPAVSAVQWNPPVRAHYERMREKGKGKMVSLGAAMRKLMMICYGVLKSQQPFDPQWQQKKQQPLVAAT
jgi:transposase